MHLSRFADELVLWASQQFGFVELPDAFATGSSMMPQKKNPDVAELIRGRTGRLYGNLVNLLTVLKGLPLAYNRDLQEDKAPLFDSVDTVRATLAILSALVPRLRVRADRMRAAAGAGYTLATELADYLATKGVPFRDAHGVVGAIVQAALAAGRQLEDFSLAELRRFSPAFGRDVRRWLSHEAAVKRRRAVGGTAPANVRRRLQALGV
jgi:argininosuccinate lyase